MTDFKNHDLHALPKPSKGRGGAAKLGLYTLAALIITGSGIYWLSRDEEDKKHITATVKENVETVVKDTPLQNVVENYLQEDTAPLHLSVTKPQTAPGTLAGQNVQAKMSAPPSITEKENVTTEAAEASDTQNAESTETTALPQEGTSLAPTPVAPKVEQDSTVPLTFVDDMASWLVTRYSPKGGISRHLSAANLRYGQNLRTLNPQGSANIQSTRASLLRYAFNSTMMSALYKLYAEHFVQSMAHAAQHMAQEKKNLPAQTILQGYATEFTSLGSVLQGLGTMPDFSKRMQAMEESVQETLRVHDKLTEAIFAFDSAVEEKKTDVADTIQLRIDGLNAQYQRSLHNRTLASESLLAAVRQQAPAASRMDGDSIVFLAQWLERRIDQGQSLSSVQKSAATAGKLLQDLAQKLQKTPLPAVQSAQM